MENSNYASIVFYLDTSFGRLPGANVQNACTPPHLCQLPSLYAASNHLQSHLMYSSVNTASSSHSVRFSFPLRSLFWPTVSRLTVFSDPGRVSARYFHFHSVTTFPESQHCRYNPWHLLAALVTNFSLTPRPQIQQHSPQHLPNFETP